MKMINDWKPETQALLKSFTDAGFTLVHAHNGEDGLKFNNNLPEFIECLTACDESTLHVEKGTKRARLFLVYGNSPGELVSDYAYPSGDDAVTEAFVNLLDEVMSAHYDAWVEKPQPKIPSPYEVTL